MGGAGAMRGGNSVGMVLVTMEAQVAPEQEKALMRAYAHVMRHRPAAILQSMLTQDCLEPTIWRIYTVWESREALEAHYRENERMPSAYVFHLAGLIPIGASSDIIAFENE
jgi:quinol monooxygenase YgiN